MNTSCDSVPDDAPGLTPEAVAAAWDDEIARRICEVEEGRVQCLSHEQFVALVDAARVKTPLLVLLVLSLFATGCARSRLVYRDHDFQLSEMRQHGLAIGGFSGLSKDQNMAEVFDLMLRRQLAGKHPHLSLISLVEVRSALGAERHGLIVAEASEKFGPSDSDLRPLSVLRDRARYALWIHLSGFRGATSQHASPITETDSTYNSKTKSYDSSERIVGYDLSASSFARSDAVVFVYDLERERFVWVGEGRGYSHARNSPDAAGALYHPPNPGPLGPLVAATETALGKWK